MDIFPHALSANRLRITIYISAPARTKNLRTADTTLLPHKQTKGITLYQRKPSGPHVDAPCDQEIPHDLRIPCD